MTHFALITRTPRSHGSRRNRRLLRIDQRVARPAIGRAHDDASRGQVVLRRRQNLPCNGSADPSAEGKKPKKQEKDFGSFEEIRANFLRNGSPTDPSAPNPLRSTPPRLHPYARTPVPSPHAPPPSARRRPSHRRPPPPLAPPPLTPPRLRHLLPSSRTPTRTPFCRPRWRSTKRTTSAAASGPRPTRTPRRFPRRRVLGCLPHETSSTRPLRVRRRTCSRRRARARRRTRRRRRRTSASATALARRVLRRLRRRLRLTPP